MTRLRLMADDLTGALDAAAEFTAATGPVTVRWSGDVSASTGSLAFDIGTREATRAAAVAAAEAAAPILVGADIAVLKVDSLLRGNGMAELGACLSRGGFDACVVAPAFPHQGRVTRGGVQYRRAADGGWEAVADIVARLTDEGIAARRGAAGEPLDAGTVVLDAETDADLDRAASLGAAYPGRLLWCGSAGLAAAIARRAAARYVGGMQPSAPVLARPVLGLFGSDQAATALQLAACGPRWHVMPDGSPESAGRLAAALAADGVALASLALPAGLSRIEAAALIGGGLGALALRLPRPGTLLVAGGETLRALCAALGTEALAVTGRFEPGVPVSTLRGGRWDGLRAVSKSGAFGGPNLWRDLVAPALLTTDALP